MRIFVYIIVRLVYYLLTAIELCMLVRAVMSWIMPEEDNKIYNFVCAVTDPLIYPVGRVLDRFSFTQNLPIDLSFIVTYILIVLIQNLLPSVNI